MVVNELEFSYRNFTFGGATDYPVVRVEGLDPPNNREDIIDRAVDHGSFIYSEFLENRRITIDGFIVAPDPATLQSRLRTLKAAFMPVDLSLGLQHRWPGEQTKLSFCVPVKRSYPTDLDFTLGYADWSVQFLAGDPRIYDEVQSEITLARGASGVATNAGDFPTYPVVEIVGSATNPSLTNQTTGETLTFNTTLATSDTLVIDFLEKTATLNNSVSRYGTRNPTSQWWDLEAGNNTVAYAADSGTGTARFVWRSAWL